LNNASKGLRTGTVLQQPDDMPEVSPSGSNDYRG
jgi:hypothetical protein